MKRKGMPYEGTAHGRGHHRINALIAAFAVLGALLSVPFIAGAPPAQADTGVRLPLLLVHGFSDNCHDAYNYVSQNSSYRGSYDVTTESYLSGHGFSDVRAVGYYTGSWTASRDNGTTAPNSTDGVASGNCTVNVQDDSTGQSHCNATWNSQTQFYTNDPIEHLACLFAWYVYELNTGANGQAPTAVDVLAHSMGGLVTRAAEYYTSAAAVANGYPTHDGYQFPPQGLRIRRVVTVATPHGGLQGAVAWFYNLNYKSQEVTDMTVCPNYAATCTLAITTPLANFASVDLKTSGLMSDLKAGGKPSGALGTVWALMGSSAQCNPLDGRTIGTCMLGRKAVGLDPFTATDFVVQSDSMMSMPADFKIFYGDIEHYNGSGVDVYSAGGPAYDHEANTCTYTLINVCATAPFYLNDSRSGSANAWVCSSACNGGIGDLPYTSPATANLYSLAEIVQLLPPVNTYSLVVRSAASGNSDFVSGEMGYTGASYAMLRARATSQGPWETWIATPLPNGNLALRSDNNNLFVSAELGYTGSDYAELRARSWVIGPWEQFQLIWNPDGTYSLKSAANGDYVSAELGYTGNNYGELRARSTSIGAWEKFTTATGPLGPSCVNYGGTTITGPDSCAGTFSTHSVWFSGGGVGLDGQEIWTYANGTVQDSTATYKLSGIGTTRVYQLQAYIPNNHSDAGNAHYRYCAPDTGTGAVVCNDGYVNQNNFTNAWATFGAVCTADGTASITLADDGGDLYPAQVGADAIRAVALSIAC